MEPGSGACWSQGDSGDSGAPRDWSAFLDRVLTEGPFLDLPGSERRGEGFIIL